MMAIQITMMDVTQNAKLNLAGYVIVFHFRAAEVQFVVMAYLLILQSNVKMEIRITMTAVTQIVQLRMDGNVIILVDQNALILMNHQQKLRELLQQHKL